ncbi:MAG: DUF1127 domain-containing protein [Pseudomonadota bacterium]
MSISANANTTGSSVRAALSQWVSDTTAYFGKRAVYARTFNELEALSDRELSDLGITRYDIKAVAYKTAFGN